MALVSACSGGDDEPGADDDPPGSGPASPSGSAARPTEPPSFEPRADVVAGRVVTGAGSGPSGAVVGHGSVWVTTHRSGELLRVDPATREIVARIAVPRGASYLEPAAEIAPGAVVMCGGGEQGSVVSVDPATNRVRARRMGCSAYSHGPLGTWVAYRDRLTRVDPVSLRVLDVIRPDVPSTAFNADLVQVDGSLWASHAGDFAELYRVDPGSGEVLGQWSFRSGNFALAALGNRVYYTDPAQDVVSVVDATTNTVTLEQPVPGNDEGDPILVAGRGQLWASTLHGGLARLDPATLEVIASADLGYQDYVGEPAVDADRVWYPTYDGDSVLEVRFP